MLQYIFVNMIFILTTLANTLLHRLLLTGATYGLGKQSETQLIAARLSFTQGAHVVGHYAAVARLIGLTEDELYTQMKQLRANLSKLSDIQMGSSFHSLT